MSVVEYTNASDWEAKEGYLYNENNLVEADTGNFMNLHQLDYFIMGTNGYVAGGIFKYIFEHKKPTDVDVYFRTRGDFLEAVNHVKRERKDWTISYKNDNVIAFNTPRNIRVEYIRTIFDSPEGMLKRFDFTIAKFAYYGEIVGDEYQSKIIHHKDYFEHLMTHRLVVDAWLNFPLSTFNRAYKYAKYGFIPCRETKAIIANSLRLIPFDIDPEDITASLYGGID